VVGARVLPVWLLVLKPPLPPFDGQGMSAPALLSKRHSIFLNWSSSCRKISARVRLLW
jgi:hypothetical protein